MEFFKKMPYYEFILRLNNVYVFNCNFSLGEGSNANCHNHVRIVVVLFQESLCVFLSSSRLKFLQVFFVSYRGFLYLTLGHIWRQRSRLYELLNFENLFCLLCLFTFCGLGSWLTSVLLLLSIFVGLSVGIHLRGKRI